MPLFIVLGLLAAACAYGAGRCFAAAGRAEGVARLRWRYHAWFFVAGTAGFAALGLVVRSPGAAIVAGIACVAALVAGVVIRSRAGRGDAGGS